MVRIASYTVRRLRPIEAGRARDCYELAAAGSGWASIRMPVAKAAPDREPEDSQVEPDRPVRNVVQVAFQPAAERGVAPPAIDLCPAGHAGFHLMPLGVAGKL